MIDGVYLAAEHVTEYKRSNDNDRRRRALIVVTDGEDRASYYREAQLFQNLREEDVQIFVIGFVNELDSDRGFIRKSPKDKAMALLNRIAGETGGRVFYPQSISELPQVAAEIVRDLRTQYVISYDPTNKAHDGTYRALKVPCRCCAHDCSGVTFWSSKRLSPLYLGGSEPDDKHRIKAGSLFDC